LVFKLDAMACLTHDKDKELSCGKVDA